jgi:hypothetical protein
MIQVMHLTAPASTLFHPDISLRVLQLVLRDLVSPHDKHVQKENGLQ